MSRNPFPQLLSMDLGPLVVLPIRRSGGAFAGALALGRRRGSSTFTEAELTRCAQFVQVISVAFELSEAQAALGQLAILDEHDRIARDLHDTVIQDLFAIGLRLEAVVSRSPPSEVTDRMHDAVAALDEVISGIRTVIFDLQSPAMAQGGLRQTVLDVTHEARSVLGFRPRVRFVGQVDATVNGTQAQSLVTVLREALSNVVRHADATEVDIVVDVTDELSLIVLDDGRGLSDGPTAGSGLVNLGARAKALGGSFSIEPRARGGTIVRWRVPIETSNDRQPTAGAV